MEVFPSSRIKIMSVIVLQNRLQKNKEK